MGTRTKLYLLKQLTSSSNSTLQSLLRPNPHLIIPTHNLINHTPKCHYRVVPPSAFLEKLPTKISFLTANSPNCSLSSFLDQWVQEGRRIKIDELQQIVRTLRSKKRFSHALEVSEWMTNNGYTFKGKLPLQLDLIALVHGLDAAERYFNEVGDQSEKTYGALLHCYVREKIVDKSLALLKKMKDLGIATNPLNYNSIMTLYMNTGLIEKVPEVLQEMEVNGVTPDNYSYRTCMKSYGLRSDFINMEKLLSKTERISSSELDWRTYLAVASCFMDGGFLEKARFYLKKAENFLSKDASGYNHLFPAYARLGDAYEVKRLWKKKCTSSRRINVDYMTVIRILVKLGDLEGAETIYKEYESTNNLYDFRVLDLLLIGYSQKGQVEKAKWMLERIICEGKTPIPNSWSIIAEGYINIQEMQKALPCMKRALELAPQREGWVPRPELISSLLKWISDFGTVEEAESFVNSLNRVINMNQEMYTTLLKVNTRHGKEVDGILQMMKANNIDFDDESKDDRHLIT